MKKKYIVRYYERGLNRYEDTNKEYNEAMVCYLDYIQIGFHVSEDKHIGVQIQLIEEDSKTIVMNTQIETK